MPPNTPEQLTLDGYYAVERPAHASGSLDFDRELRAALTRAVKETPKRRAEIAAEMTDLVFGEIGETEITKAQIDAWTAGSKIEWRFPLQYLPAFVQATGAVWLLDLVAGKCGCRVLVGEQALLAELGAIHLQKRELAARETAIKKAVPKPLLERLFNDVGGEE